MPREYRLLTDEEKDEILADFLKAQERDLFCHELNLARYEEMLPNLPNGTFKQQIQKLRAETAARIGEVEAVIAATERQLPAVERLKAAEARMAQRRGQAAKGPPAEA